MAFRNTSRSNKGNFTQTHNCPFSLKGLLSGIGWQRDCKATRTQKARAAASLAAANLPGSHEAPPFSLAPGAPPLPA